ncbi:MAG: ribosome rescue protein RqcH [Thaumarchaeota archaeon]|nr:ribosome rescue protein RqcH [Nitrososphaerota archaeon]
MAITGIELQYMTKYINKLASGYYVSNIYSINESALLFKLHHTEKSDIYLVLSTFGIWITSTKITNIVPNKLLKRLRTDIIRYKFGKIDQIELERIICITFHNHEKITKLILEFFGGGNIILCDDEMKILALLHSINSRHRQLYVGSKYEYPPKNFSNVLEMNLKELTADIKNAKTNIAKFIGINYGIPHKYVHIILVLSKIDPKRNCNDLSNDEINMLFNSIKKILYIIINGEHKTTVIEDENNELDIIPVETQLTNTIKKVSGINEGMDYIFTKKFIEENKFNKTTKVENKYEELKNRLKEQSNAIEIVKTKFFAMTELAKTLSNCIKNGIININDQKIQKTFDKYQVYINKEKNIKFLKINNKKIKVKENMSLHSIISTIYDESKKQIQSIKSIENAKNKTEKELIKIKNQATKIRNNVSFEKIRKKKWFERYRWFYTHEGLLAIGGKDTSSNSIIIRKHLTRNDIVFHADIFGSPFFILKDGINAHEDSIIEVANMTACFSRAWRESTHGLNVYWVNSTQIKKSAPSGQFLSKGSFQIEGKRNYVKTSELKLAIGIELLDGNNVIVISGPPHVIINKCKRYVIIAPTGEDISEMAKKIQYEFSKSYMNNKIKLDEIIQALPSGKSHIIDVI